MVEITVPPVLPDCRGAIVAALSGDGDVTNWYAGGNYQSEVFSKDIGAFEFLGEFSNMCTRVEMLDLDPEELFELECTKYIASWYLWVYYAGGSDALAANLMNVLVMVLKGQVISLANPDGDTVVVRQIRFLGRSRTEPYRDMWRVNSMFQGLTYYI